MLAAGLALYFTFGLAWISRPGPQQDEMLFLHGALTGNPIIGYYSAVRVFTRDIPTMVLPYLGALKGLLWRLIFLAWPPSIYSARIPIVILGGVTLLLLYFWARRFYSARVAALAVLIAGADPDYIFTSRLDWGPVVIHRLLAVAGLLLGARWLFASSVAPDSPPVVEPDSKPRTTHHGPQTAADRRGLGWLAGAGFCFGLGLWDKASFAWFLIALGITLVVLFPRQVLQRLRPAAAAVFLLALMLGASMLIRYNLSKWRPKTFRQVHVALQLGEIPRKLSSLRVTLEGRFVYAWTGGWIFDPAKADVRADGPGKVLAALSHLAPPGGTFLPWALVLAAIAACLARGARRQILFPLLLSALMWVQVFPLKEAGGPHHFSLASPFPHLAVAAAAAWAWNRLRGAVRLAPALLIAVLIATMIGWNARTLRRFRETGGAGNWSDASYEITPYLESRRPDLVMCMDWGFSNPLLLLSQARLKMQDFWLEVASLPPEELPRHAQQLALRLNRPNTLYIFHAGDYQTFKAVRRVFEAALELSHMQERVVATFKQRNGEPLAFVSEIVPAAGRL